MRWRCRHYADDGAAIGSGCPALGTCEYVHPDDQEWGSARRSDTASYPSGPLPPLVQQQQPPSRSGSRSKSAAAAREKGRNEKISRNVGWGDTWGATAVAPTTTTSAAATPGPLQKRSAPEEAGWANASVGSGSGWPAGESRESAQSSKGASKDPLAGWGLAPDGASAASTAGWGWSPAGENIGDKANLKGPWGATSSAADKSGGGGGWGSTAGGSAKVRSGMGDASSAGNGSWGSAGGWGSSAGGGAGEKSSDNSGPWGSWGASEVPSHSGASNAYANANAFNAQAGASNPADMATKSSALPGALPVVEQPAKQPARSVAPVIAQSLGGTGRDLPAATSNTARSGEGSSGARDMNALETIDDVHQATTKFVRGVTDTIDSRLKSQEASKKEERTKRMRKSAAYERSSMSARGILDNARELIGKEKVSAEAKLAGHLGDLTLLPEVGAHMSRIDPSYNNETMQSYLDGVDAWYSRSLEPGVQALVAEQKAKEEMRSEFEPESIPPMFEKYVSAVRKQDETIKDIMENVSQASDTDLIAQLNTYFHEEGASAIEDAIRTAHENHLRRRLQPRLEALDKLEKEIGSAIEDHANAVAAKITSDVAPEQPSDLQQEIQRWRIELEAKRAANKHDLQTIREMQQDFDAKLAQSLAAPVSSANVDATVASLDPHIGALTKAHFEPALDNVYTNTLDAIRQQHKAHLEFVWRAMLPSIILTHYMEAKSNSSS